MNFVIVFGPLAMGKMTVGQELEKITDLKLFHNHMTIDMILPYFVMKSPSFKKLVNAFRIQMFEEVAKSDLSGLIFTYVWELDSKNDIEASEKELLDTDLKYTLYSRDNEFEGKHHIRINNTNLPADATAKLISERFDLGT